MIQYITIALLVVIILIIQYKIRFEKRPDGTYITWTKYVWDPLTRDCDKVNFRKKIF